MKSKIEKHTVSGKVYLWMYTENQRNYPGWNLTTDSEGSSNLLELLDLMEGSEWWCKKTFLALEHLYPKLSIGGYLIIDDYKAFPFCKSAGDTYRTNHGITEAIIKIDDEAVYWRVMNQPTSQASHFE